MCLCFKTEAVSRLGLASFNIVVCQRDDLVAEHVGGSERKTRELLKKASGGVLVVDEVYRLNVKARDFGQEVVESVETLMRYMTPGNESTQNVPAPAMMIFVGYHHLMEKFLKMNPGLSRRILHRVHLQDFSLQEILTICFNILRDEVGLDTSTVGTTVSIKAGVSSHIRRLYKNKKCQLYVVIQVNSAKEMHK